MFNQPPKILRIKRKRHQDPLQALILEDRRSVKRSKPSSPVTSPRLSPTTTTPVTTTPLENHNYVFKLARTDESDKVNAHDESIIQTILSESQTGIDENSLSEPTKRNFVIPKHQTEEDIEIPNELSDMLDSFLSLEKIMTPSEGKEEGETLVKNLHVLHNWSMQRMTMLKKKRPNTFMMSII